MHITASSPLAIESTGIDKTIVEKENEIIKAELINSGKKGDMIEKISKGKLSKFLNDNSLLNQIWIMDPKKKVADILKEKSSKNEIKVLDFIKPNKHLDMPDLINDLIKKKKKYFFLH